MLSDRDLPHEGVTSGRGSSGPTTPTAGTEGAPSAYFAVHPSDDAATAAAVDVLERHVELMTLFYQHLTACPPHGPFRYYGAITFVERARRRLFPLGEGDATARGGGDATGSSSGRVDGSSPEVTPNSEELNKALTVSSVLALMERKYNTAHLAGWPLMYVPAEIHAADVDAVIGRQQRTA